MKCDNCPAAWEKGGWTECGYECDSYGCMIFGEGIGGEGERCYLTMEQVDKRLTQLEEYNEGKIDRPQWLANRFVAEMDRAIATFPYFPPKRVNPRKMELDGEEVTVAEYVRVIHETSQYYELDSAYRKGYEDAKAGKSMRGYFDNGATDGDGTTLDDIFG